jgi:trimeric autotransporter adhesin
MKQLTLLVLLIVFSCGLNAQSVGINVTGASPNSSAMLDINSTTKGLLIPRLTTVQIHAIVSPANGLLVFNVTTNQLWVNVKDAASPLWQTVSANSSWSLSGNNGINPANNFIGTTDKNPIRFKVNSIRIGELSEENIFLGTDAGINTTSANSTIGIGRAALLVNTIRKDLLAIGDSALMNNGTGAIVDIQASNNLALGHRALLSNTTGYENTAIGQNSLSNNINGHRNIAIGYGSLLSNTSGTYNVAIGSGALAQNLGGTMNIAIGLNTLGLSTASENIGIGAGAMYFNTTGGDNIAMGRNTLYTNTTGSENIAIGNFALNQNDLGQEYRYRL